MVEYDYHYAHIGNPELHPDKGWAVICECSGDPERGLHPFTKYLVITADKESARRICLLLTECNAVTLPYNEC